jgi:hypothetical protein
MLKGSSFNYQLPVLFDQIWCSWRTDGPLKRINDDDDVTDDDDDDDDDDVGQYDDDLLDLLGLPMLEKHVVCGDVFSK